MARKLLIFFLLLSWCVFTECSDFEIPYKTPQNCEENQYFRFSTLSCENCRPDQATLRRSEDRLSCVCRTGYKLTEYKGGPEVVCEKCVPENTTNSLDGSFCIKCPENVGFNVLTGTCESCPENSFPADRDRNGAQLTTRKCVRCEGETRPGANFKEACRLCHSSFLDRNNSSCFDSCSGDEYEISGGVCFKKTDLKLVTTYPNLYRVKYGDEVITSTYFEENLRAAEALCRANSNFTACQLLGNLCVLLNYIEEEDACKFYLDLFEKVPPPVTFLRNDDWPVDMPWLYYESYSVTEVVDDKGITQKFESNAELSFLFAVFTLNGSFVGTETGLDVLHLCRDRPSRIAAASKFATTYRSSCSVTVKEMNNSSFFYDMYLIVGDALYPVPLLVENYRSSENEAVNEGTDRDKWKLTRRFYLVESIVGMSVNNKWMRFAEKIELNIRMRSSDGEIFPPLLRIRYRALDVNNEEVLNGNHEVSFAVTYEMDDTKITKDTEVKILHHYFFSFFFLLLVILQ